MQKWTTANIPSLTGKTAIITGVGGLGFEDALALSRAGSKVIIAGRDATKGQAAVDAISNKVADADIQFELIDLADLASVAAFSKRMTNNFEQIDILINNAGVMTPPKRLETKDGFELQFGTNYLSHFALTAHLLPLIKKARGRVVSLSSVAARKGMINFDDLQATHEYKPMPVYAQSKLACLMFAFELQKQSDKNNWGITSIAAHPGVSRTQLLAGKSDGRGFYGLARKYAWFMFQPVAQGALTTLFAATSPEAKPGKYYGPDALNETRGYPTEAYIPKNALDSGDSMRLWEISEKLSNVHYQ
jgi:NAD(P)-dependent dehydrogenase (short-subunit alcohol dehydrogenase family)